VIVGKLNVNSISETVLFNYGASYSFIHEGSVDEQVIVGKLNVNSISERVLFDYGTSHSLINEDFVPESNLPVRELHHAFQVLAPGITHEN
jgi:hypothetical protein